MPAPRLQALRRYSSSPSRPHGHGEVGLNSFSLTPEEEASVAQIKKTVSKSRRGSVQDLIQSLALECSSIRLSDGVVDCLLCKLGDDWKSALGFFQWAQSRADYRHTPYACNRMVDLLGKMRQIDRMWDLLHDIHLGGMITVETVAKGIRRLAGARRWKDVNVLFDKLEEMGLERNTETMNILLDALCKERKVEAAREVFVVLSSIIPPDAYTFNILVHGWCSANRTDEAMWTIEEMKGRGFPPSVITYSTVLEAYCKHRNFRKVYEVLDVMVSQGCPPNVITYTMIMNSLAKSGRFEEALSVSQRMKSTDCKPDTLFYNSLINILGRAGQLSEASQIFEVEMPTNGMARSLATYNIMIAIFCYHSREEDALNVLKVMEALSCKPDLQTYGPLLKLYLSRRDLPGHIHQLLQEITDKHNLGLDLDTYTLLIHGLCRVGETEWACRLFDEMVASEIVPRRRTCELLLSEAQMKNMIGYLEVIHNAMNRFGFSQ